MTDRPSAPLGQFDRRRSSRPRPPGFVLIVASSLALAAGACSSHAKSPVTSTTRSTTSTTLDVNAQVLAGLDGFHKAYTAAIAAPNPSDPTLAQYMTGVELAHLHVFLLQLVDSGRLLRAASTDRHARVVSVQGTTAIVDECTTNSSGHFYDAKTGRDTGLSGDPNRPDGNEFAMQLEGGTWKVASSTTKATACP